MPKMRWMDSVKVSVERKGMNVEEVVLNERSC
jgi:hypothetical protein